MRSREYARLGVYDLEAFGSVFHFLLPVFPLRLFALGPIVLQIVAGWKGCGA